MVISVLPPTLDTHESSPVPKSITTRKGACNRSTSLQSCRRASFASHYNPLAAAEAIRSSSSTRSRKRSQKDSGKYHGRHEKHSHPNSRLRWTYCTDKCARHQRGPGCCDELDVCKNAVHPTCRRASGGSRSCSQATFRGFAASRVRLDESWVFGIVSGGKVPLSCS